MAADRKSTVVLAIDGDTVRRGMLACTLPPDDYAVEFAKTPESGLDLLGKLRPAVIVLGLDDSTAELCQRIRQLPAGDSCLLVVIDERLSEAAPATVPGADIALPFPFELELFQKQCEEHRARPAAVTRQMPPVEEATMVDVADTQEATAADGTRRADADAWGAFRQRVATFHARLSELDYFQLLEVPRGATLAEIKDAYFQRSMEFHPDRFMRLEDEELKSRNYEVYKRMTEAFRVLTQPQTRASYEQDDLDAPAESRSLRYRGSGAAGGSSAACTPAGCRYLRFAELARQGGNLKSAKMYLTLAVQQEPSNEALRHKLEQVSAELK